MAKRSETGTDVKEKPDEDYPRVGIIMGSSSDKEIMQPAGEVLQALKVAYEFTIVSAHRSPKRMVAYAEAAERRGLEVIIAGAGGAAHLPGMVASLTVLPVIGVPVRSSNSLQGLDSLLSIVQMPNGIPVATVAINAARNAGLLAARFLAGQDQMLRTRLHTHQKELRDKVDRQIEEAAYTWPQNLNMPHLPEE